MYHGFNLSNDSKGETFPISLASSTVKSGSKKNSVLFTTKLKRAAFRVTGPQVPGHQNYY